MSEWWTYSPADFLMFSPGTYWRLFELYNRDVWPVQIAALALGAALPFLAGRGGGGGQRLAAAILAAAWGWTAWAFLLGRYDTINWAGRYLAIGFATEALLLAGLGLAGRLRIEASGATAGRVGLGVFLAALLFYPWIAVVSGRPWTQAEIFGLAPDPTAIGTLGLLLAAQGGTGGLLRILPALWCLFSGVTLWSMGAWEAALPLAVLAATAVMIVAGRKKTSLHCK